MDFFVAFMLSLEPVRRPKDAPQGIDTKLTMRFVNIGLNSCK
jgi:hypothetical protein